MSVFVWSTTRDRAIERFRGDTPGGQLEQTILAHFEREPQRVIDSIEQIGRSIERGGPNAPVSGWAVLAKTLTTPAQERVVTDHAEMAKQLTIAENWIRNAGAGIDREAELIAELYDTDLGRLRHWPDTQADIVKIWEEHRPRFAKTEREAVERNTLQAANRLKLRGRPRLTCTYCERTTRGTTGLCSEHRHIAEEDFRYADPPDDAWLDDRAAAQPEAPPLDPPDDIAA